MKETAERLICSRHCVFYKEGKEVLLCGTVRYLLSRYTLEVIEALQTAEGPDHTEDEWIKKEICEQCEFFPEECGFRMGLDSPPCGGYLLVEVLRKKGL